MTGTPQFRPGSPAPPVSMPRLYRGMNGFDGRAALPAAPDEAPDSFEPVRGYRWWTIPAPPLHLNPAHAEECWPRPLRLRGTVDYWQPGENVAACRHGAEVNTLHDPALIPLSECGCGFWAYWQVQDHDLGRQALPVLGVIEGYGAVLLGTKGFRAARARIVALHLAWVADPVPSSGLKYGRHNPWWNHPQFHGRVYGDYRNACPGGDLAPAGLSEAEMQEARDWGKAWLAVIGDRLEQEYPGVVICETMAALRARFPATPPDLPDPVCTCPEDISESWHLIGCPAG